MVGLLVIASVYGSFGLLGYFTFGDASQGSISQNLPNGPIYMLLKVRDQVNIRAC